MMWLESLSRGNSWCSRNLKGKYSESFTSKKKNTTTKLFIRYCFQIFLSCDKIYLLLICEIVSISSFSTSIQMLSFLEQPKNLIDSILFRSDMEIENENLPFLYKLVGTWAFSPHPKYVKVHSWFNKFFKDNLFYGCLTIMCIVLISRQWRSLLTWFRSLDSETFDP